ncbi:uncharacterized protein LOC118583974 isoform X2 [Onychomys torridus]|uniref:uncharacterized protein LOC118583974 isoform X2 n=1 Tax=Onychomys torridus TaxID=38674 RepID=UPI00167FB36D|nr:uncharacterized protein LOC118583974 isoform X2 [Onychomys torridus]
MRARLPAKCNCEVMWKSEPGASPDGSHWAELRGRSTTWKFVVRTTFCWSLASTPRAPPPRESPGGDEPFHAVRAAHRAAKLLDKDCRQMKKRMHRRCCHVGNWLLLVRFSSACTGTGSVRWISKLFFFSFYFKCPLASNICAGCYVERGRGKKEKSNPPIVLIPELLHSPCFFPQRGHFHTSIRQNKKSCLMWI